MKDETVNITKRDVLWGYIAQFFNFGISIILLPILLRYLSSQEIGIWYIFATMSGFLMMLDFGFLPTISRNVGYIFNGAARLRKEGIDENSKTFDAPNYPLLKNIIGTVRKMYGLLSLVSLILLLSLGSWYIGMKAEGLEKNAEILWAWVTYAIATVINFYYSYYNALLVGRGLVRKNNLLIIVSKSTYILFACIGLLCGYGLIAIASGYLLSVVVDRMLASRFFYSEELKQVLCSCETNRERLFPILWYNAKKVGLANVGAFFVRQGNLFFASIFLPLDIIASYGLTVSVAGLIATVSPIYLNTHLPVLLKEQLNHNVIGIKRIFGESLICFYGIYLAGALILLLLGEPVLELIDSNTRLLPLLPMALLLIVQFLESNHALAASLISTQNKIPFLKAALISGFSIGMLSVLSLAFTSLEVVGIILSTGVVQLVYNNWKWPVVVCRDLNTSYVGLLHIGAASLCGKR